MDLDTLGIWTADKIVKEMNEIKKFFSESQQIELQFQDSDTSEKEEQTIWSHFGRRVGGIELGKSPVTTFSH